MSSRHSRPTVPPDNKKACQLYFCKDPIVDKEENMWKYSCGTIQKQDIKVGYTNLISHIRQKHPNYLRFSIWRNKRIANLKHLVSSLDTVHPHQCRGRLHWTTCLIRHPPTYSSGLSGLSWMSTNWRFATRSSHEAIQNLTPSLSRHSRITSSRW